MARQTISEIKAEIGYEAKPVVPSCSNCESFSSDLITEKWHHEEWTTEKNIRCTFFHDRHFKVSKRGKCNNHQFKEEQK